MNDILPPSSPTEADWAGILERLRGFQGGRIILTAHELGLFDQLGAETATAEEVAARIGASRRGTVILLDALAALGVVTKTGDRYRNGAAARRHLCRSGADFRGGMLDHFLGMAQAWSQLPAAVRSGTMPTPHAAGVIGDAERNRTFIAAMAEMGRENGRILASCIDFSNRRRLLDLGGGPGAYASEILLKNPEMTAVVADLPITVQTARAFVERDPAAARITLREADFFAEADPDLGEGYDAVLISNVLHVEGVAENRRLLQRVHAAMAPGGLLIIHEALIEPERTRPLDRALFAVNMLVHTSRGDCYTFDEIGAWLAEAGFENIAEVDCFKQPSLMVGYRRP